MKLPFSAFALLGAFAFAIPQAAPAGAGKGPAGESAVRRFALAIGSSYGGHGRDTLLYTAADAGAFGKVLMEMGGVAEADAKVLSNPTPSGLAAAMKDLRARVTAHSSPGRTEVVVYYSGHADDKGLLLGDKSFDYDRFRREMDSIPAHVRIAVLDACASGAITRLKGGRRRPAFTVDASSDMRGYAFLTSSSPEEASQESDQIRSSFFTHYLVSALRGAADVSGDGKVTLGEAYQFAFHETLARTERTKGGPQHPAYDMKLSGTGDVVMTDMRETSAGLVLGKDLEGRFFVRTPSGLLAAELYKPMGRVVELGLAPGNYSVRMERPKGLADATVDLEEGKRRALGGADFLASSRDPALQRGKGGERDSAGATDETGGFRMEINDQVDMGLPAGMNRDYTFSVGVFLNQQRKPFHGLQLALFFNHAAAELWGGQVSVFGNATRGSLEGFQASAVGNVAADSVRGLQFAPLFNIAAGPVVGGQGSAVINVARGVHGGQGSAVANINWGPLKGGQGAAVLNVAGPVSGGQGSGVMNIAAGPVRGGQAAAVANIAAGHLRGGQASAVLNVADGVEGGQATAVANISFGPVVGGQGAAVLNLARGVQGGQGSGVANLSLGDVKGFQAAAVLNAARDVKGLQVSAILNAARDVDGSQIGLVNVSRDIRNGIPFGLINYSHTGLHSANLSVDELGFQHFTLLSGSRNFYTYFSAGEKLAVSGSQLALGFGMGLHLDRKDWFGEVDLGVADFHRDNDFDGGGPELYRLRLGAGRELLPYVSLFGGLSLNCFWDQGGESATFPMGDYQARIGGNVFAWPGFFLGLRVGK